MKIIINQEESIVFFNDNYIEYDTKVDKNKTASIKEYSNMFKQHLKDIIIDIIKLMDKGKFIQIMK